MCHKVALVEYLCVWVQCVWVVQTCGNSTTKPHFCVVFLLNKQLCQSAKSIVDDFTIVIILSPNKKNSYRSNDKSFLFIKLALQMQHEYLFCLLQKYRNRNCNFLDDQHFEHMLMACLYPQNATTSQHHIHNNHHHNHFCY